MAEQLSLKKLNQEKIAVVADLAVVATVEAAMAAVATVVAVATAVAATAVAADTTAIVTNRKRISKGHPQAVSALHIAGC